LNLTAGSFIWLRLKAKWASITVPGDGSGNILQYPASFDQHVGIFGLAASIRKQLKKTQVADAIKAKLITVTTDRLPSLSVFDCRAMSMWIFSIYRDFSRSTDL